MQGKTVDPYYEWLGIPPKDQPPNHYRLLGLELFEENRNVIDAAANRQMSFIKEYQAGADSDLSQRLLNELSAARLCLLSPVAKAAYDDQLRATLESREVPAVPARTSADGRWRNETGIAQASAVAFIPADQPASATMPPAANQFDSGPASVSLEPPLPAVIERQPEVRPQPKTQPVTLIVAVALAAAMMALVLALVLARSMKLKTEFPDDVMAEALREQSADVEQPMPAEGDHVTASPPAVFTLPPEPVPQPELAEPPAFAPQPPKQPMVSPTVELLTDQPALPAEAPPPPPPVETLDQAEQRLKAAAGRAATPDEHQAVARESLVLVDKAIVDSQVELAKRVAQLALAAARKSESEDLERQATLLWTELALPLTDEGKERARQRLRGNLNARPRQP